MSLSYTIRLARLGDERGIARVHIDSWRTTYTGIMPQSVLEGLSMESRIDLWAKNITRPAHQRMHLSVAQLEESGQIVAFCEVGPTRKPELSPKISPEIYYDAEMPAIYTFKEHQGRGIGTMLFCEAVQWLQANGFRSLCLWVLKDNSSRRFYERMGGQLCGEKQITIESNNLTEVAYGWPELHSFKATAFVAQ